ncbi:MAG TPA: OsmC family protein [Bdellovibrionota bacterium]|jgi:putative redox protein
MKLTTTWHPKMRFEAVAGENVTWMDASPPFGEGKYVSPKQMLLAAICGCTGIDVMARMRKFKQNPSSLKIEADAPKREGKPATFDSVMLDYYFEGEVDEKIAIDAVVASQSEECGVSAMVAAHCPIRFRIHLNGRLVREGSSKFVR